MYFPKGGLSERKKTFLRQSCLRLVRVTVCFLFSFQLEPCLVLLLALLYHYHTSELINTSVSSFWVGVRLFRHHTYVSAECVTVPKWELQNGVEDLIPVKCSCLVSTRRTCEISLVSREPEYIPVVLRCVRCGLYLCYGWLANVVDCTCVMVDWPSSRTCECEWTHTSEFYLSTSTCLWTEYIPVVWVPPSELPVKFGSLNLWICHSLNN